MDLVNYIGETSSYDKKSTAETVIKGL